MIKLLYKPVGLVAGVVGGLLAGLTSRGSGSSSVLGERHSALP
jgi:hypothetical protein